MAKKKSKKKAKRTLAKSLISLILVLILAIAGYVQSVHDGFFHGPLAGGLVVQL